MISLLIAPSAASFTSSPARAAFGRNAALSLAPGGDSSTKSPTPAKKENDFLRKALLQNVMFTSLPELALNSLMDGFEKIELTKDQVIVRQGDSSAGDYVYVIAEGECNVMVDGKIVPEPYGTLQAKSIIGELAVMYNKNRSATVSTKSDTVTLYRIEGTTFKKLLNTLPRMDDAEQMKKIDDVLKQIAGTKSLFDGNFILPYKPDRWWLWSRWKGTILLCSTLPTCLNMLFSLVFILVTRQLTDPTLKFCMAPDKSHALIARLDIVQRMWSYQMSLTTFILTFFVNHSYSLWQNVHGIARRVQGRLNDFNLLLATSAKRNEDGSYTPESQQLLDDVASYSRLFHSLFWASHAKRFDVLLTDQGLETMASRGLMTSNQLSILQNLDLPRNQRYNACLEWMMERACRGVDDGTIRDYKGSTILNLQNTMLTLCATYLGLGSALSTRMPLAYTHFVQILVDAFVFLAPVALYSTLGDMSLICVGIITLFYTGLLNLAKIFLDPLDNENFSGDSFDMDLGVLIREANSGSTRWKNAGARLPF